jgi:hypothetical protein
MIHGHKRKGMATPEYKTWLAMKARCYTKSNKDFAGWGGKGIRVCDRWRDSFETFLRDMHTKPSADHTIDRLDSNADYSPENCRWATRSEQGAEHRHGLVPVSVGGLDFPSQAAACRFFGVRATTVNERLKAGISLDEAFQSNRLKSRRTRESYLRKDRR